MNFLRAIIRDARRQFSMFLCKITIVINGPSLAPRREINLKSRLESARLYIEMIAYAIFAATNKKKLTYKRCGNEWRAVAKDAGAARDEIRQKNTYIYTDWHDRLQLDFCRELV